MKKTIEKSQEQVDIVTSVALFIQILDVEYCREAAEDMIKDASRYDSMAALNPSYNPEHGQLMRKQAEALTLLCDYVDTLKEIDKLKAGVKTREEFNTNLNKIFGL